MSRDLLDLVTEQEDNNSVFPSERFGDPAARPAHPYEHGEYLGYSLPSLLERLTEEAQKIHQQRPVLQETLAAVSQPMSES